MNIKKIFQEKYIRYTKKKGLILEKIIDLNHSFSANDLHISLQKSSDINRSTVYRALARFKEAGVVREFLGEDGTLRYDFIDERQNPHPHFECRVCSRRICLDELGFYAGIYLSKLAKGHKIERIDLSFSGVCKECLQKNISEKGNTLCLS